MKSTLRNKIKLRCREMGITLEELAYITGISRGTLAHYIKTEHIGTAYSLLAISIALNVPVAYLVKEEYEDIRMLVAMRLDDVRKGDRYKKRIEERKRWLKK